MKRNLGLFILATSLVIAGCMSVENSIVYRPAPGTTPYAAPPAPLHDIELTADGNKIPARWAPHPRATGAVLFCHGNGGNVEQWAPAVRELWENLGESVLIFDYPGYGYSGGAPSEKG